MYWRYYLPYRPAGPGAIPRGAELVHNYDWKTVVPEAGMAVYGYAEYKEPLSESDIRNYELVADARNPLPF